MSRSLLCSPILQIKNCVLLNACCKTVKQNHSTFEQWKNISVKLSCRQLSHKSTEKSKKQTGFAQFINFRKEEAKRSIVVQVQSAYSFKELHAYCRQLGTVKQMFHYTTGVEPLHFILVEFATENEVKNVLSASCHMDDNQAVPVKSPFLWFRVAAAKKTTLKLSKSFRLAAENGNKPPTNDAIKELVSSAENISDQMRILYNLTKLNDLGVRLRFLTAHQIELALAGMFPDATAYPFGSSINGYGKMGCDLDLVLKVNGANKENPASRLIFQCKAGLGNERSQSQRHMETIGDVLHLFLPGCSQVRRILQARVPILKYNQQFTDVECDLSMTNMTALHMSEILYVLGELDDRVRPLVFTIRKWAQETGLTNSSPGRWITNFSLTLLVLAFLQKTPTSVPVLPSLNTFIKTATGEETIPEDDIYSSFLQNNLDQQEKNLESLETLLLQFFEYYSNFDFVTKAISLNEAAIIPKPEHSALYIVNPLERGLNVSKNVSSEELERLKMEVRNAAWILESQEKKSATNWGILSIFSSGSNKKQRGFYAPVKYNRMMEVKELFEDENLEDLEAEMKDKDKNSVAYKNEMVHDVKKETEAEEISDNEKIKENPRRTTARRR